MNVRLVVALEPADRVIEDDRPFQSDFRYRYRMVETSEKYSQVLALSRLCKTNMPFKNRKSSV